jgi:hypothetical protein
MTLSVQTLDRKIWRKDSVISYLHQCHNNNRLAVIDFGPEGSCAESLGMYRLLDEFCQSTGYSKQNISIQTANMLETHAEYNIVRKPSYWYEIESICTWMHGKTIISGNRPTRHFANFISRSNWYRLWIATILNNKYKNKTLQSYHYDPEKENYNYNGYLGLDDLFKFGCDIVPRAADFLTTCPRTIDVDFLKIQDYSNSIFQHQASYYPIQYPANLNLLQYYKDIFVDIVCEPNASGTCFLCTEKIWRPIVARRPFIVMSNFEYLHNLKKLGFKTFNEFWDESYDGYSEGERIKKIEKILEQIAQWSTRDLHIKLKEMKSILDHNYQAFNDLTYSDITRAFDGSV